MAGQLACEELCEQGERTTPASPMHVDMIARVEGLPNVTQSSLGGCRRRSVTTWSAPILSVSTRFTAGHELS